MPRRPDPTCRRLHFFGTLGLFAVLAGVIITSSLLHFYYDGFIWKLRDGSIKEGLDLRTGNPQPRRARPPSRRGGRSRHRRLARRP